MVRPRLVQEGTPIYGPGSEGTIIDHEMGDHDRAPKESTPVGFGEANDKATPPSSLQRAAGASSLPKMEKKKHSSSTQTNFVVGGDDVPHTEPPATNYSQQPPELHHHYHHHPWTHTIQPQQTHHDHAGMGHETMVDEDHKMHVHQYSVAQHHASSHQHYQIPMQHQQHFQHQVGHFQPSPPMHYSHYQIGDSSQSYSSNEATPSSIQSSFVIGTGNDQVDDRLVEKMEGVVDTSHKLPLVVLDGANVAHAYTSGMAGSSLQAAQNQKIEADARGIQVATEYFQSTGVRVLIVLPQYWFRSKPRPDGKPNTSNLMETQLETLQHLQSQGLIVASPPADDDDAYALTIARREESRSLRRSHNKGEGPGFVVSNDMFRDAQRRDTSGALADWLNNGRNEAIGPGRISYTFCDMGTMNDHGERILDFVPNPRHSLVKWVETQHQH